MDQAQAGSSTLRTRTFRLDRDVPIVEVGARSGLLWSRGGFSLAGIGEAARLPLDRSAHGGGGFGPTADALAALVDPEPGDAAGPAGPGTGPVAFAALPFDPDAAGELVVPRVLVGANAAGVRWLSVTSQSAAAADASVAVRAAEAELDQLLATPGAATSAAATSASADPADFRLRSVLPAEVWRDEVVAAARDRIRDGELVKAVLARELVLTTDRPIDPAAVVRRLAQVFPAAALFLVDDFVGASPELLVSRIDDVVRAHPLAGTAARSTDPLIDQRNVGNLLASDKDRWEHRITIDWLLDTLLPFCSYVDAEPEPSIVTLANVHHLGTRVEGRLSSPAAPILELVAALHPTPAVGGSPAKDALAVIDELERAARGRYAGPTGWVDGAGNGEFAVAIRSAQLGGTEARFFAGVGVVGDSDPAAELAETRAKFRAMLGALIVP
ncbi:MAG: isochorismate synthase [Actinomycetota bacterium]